MLPPNGKSGYFLRTGPFFMSNSGNGSYGQCASYAFGFIKNIVWAKRYSAENCLSCFFITWFSKIFLKYNFEKSKKTSDCFLKIIFIDIFDEQYLWRKTKRNFDFLKSLFLIFQKIFFEKIFLKIELWKKCHKMFSAVTFEWINIFI